MQGYLIDPFTRTVEVVLVAPGLSEIYAHIKAVYFDVARLSTGDVVYVGDDSLLGDLSEQQFFAVLPLGPDDMPHFLAGRGLVVGTTGEGDDCDPAITLQALRDHIQFFDHEVGAAIAQELLGMLGSPAIAH